MIINIGGIKDTQRLAVLTSKHIKNSDVILLKGDLGSGKTTFAQFFIKNLTHAENVSSPTFNIVNIYEKDDITIWHYDLYRIKNIEEIYEIGIEESLSNAVSIIEWPELIESIIHENKIIIYFIHNHNENGRKVQIEFKGRFLTEEKVLLERLKNEFR